MKKGHWLWFYWPAALAFIALVLFAPAEWYALHRGGPTFSAFMATMAYHGPIGLMWVFSWGMLIGGLVVHFFGWCATPRKELGNDD